MASLEGEIAAAYRTLAGVTNVYHGEKPADVQPPLLVFRIYAGSADPMLPTQAVSVQVTAYATGQEAANALAEGVRTLLHRKQAWNIGSYIIGNITCDPVLYLPPWPATGEKTCRAAVSMRLIVKPSS